MAWGTDRGQRRALPGLRPSASGVGDLSLKRAVLIGAPPFAAGPGAETRETEETRFPSLYPPDSLPYEG